MKSIGITLLAGAVILAAGTVLAQHAGDALTLQYGTVESMKVVQKSGSRAGGTAIGGIAGAAIADDHRGLGMIAGGLLGGGIQKHHTAGTLDQYSILLNSGVITIVNSDQNDLIIGDCVVVEQGQYTNVRRVSSINCHQNQQPAHHVEAASNCQAAKDELNSAKTDDAIEQAVIKVRTLCED